jgi:hypothetical protein
MSYIRVTLDGVTHELNPANLCTLRDQITKQADSLSIFESIKLANALQITGSQLIQFMTGLKKR